MDQNYRKCAVFVFCKVGLNLDTQFGKSIAGGRAGGWAGKREVSQD